MDDDLDLALKRLLAGPIDVARPESLAAARIGAAASVSLEDLLLRGLGRAIDREDDVAVEALLIVSARDGHRSLRDQHLPVLGALLLAEWHLGHEGLVSCVEAVGGDATLPILVRALDARPDYLDRVDACAALHRRIVWAVAKVGTEAARETLQSLAGSGRDTVARHAEKRLMDFELRGG